MNFPTRNTAWVRERLAANREIALLDLREEGVFAEAHPLFGASLPFSQIELEIYDRIPRRDTPIVLYDDGEGLIAPAYEKLRELRYSDVAILEGGLSGWRASGGEIFRDVNTPSKAFGELVEARRHTPSLSAPEVKARIDAGDDIVILDARRFDEYNTMNIPGSVSVPGGELVHRAASLAPDSKTTIIVNCAGRTRSLIGAQSLINAGFSNKVFALRNGTIGWTLADQTLEHGQTRRFSNGAQAKADIATRARSLADNAGVTRIKYDQLAAVLSDTSRTHYRFDVRTPEEYALGHFPRFRSAPGGQLVQETDVFAPVRGGRIILADDTGVRANMTASWLAQMNWEVSVLDKDVRYAGHDVGAWEATRPPTSDVAGLSAAEVSKLLQDGRGIALDLSPSAAFAKAHIPGARFALRSLLDAALIEVGQGTLPILTSEDGILASFAANDLLRKGLAVPVLRGGNAAWSAAGLPSESGLTHLASPPIDRYRRPYEGTDNPVSAMQAYLDWEYGLVAQLDRDATHGFRVL